MAGASFFALIDDIATLLDDVAAMTKVAAGKTAGVLGDDLALNAQQVAGVRADRELPVVWAVATGSIRNKLVLVPLALALSALLPWIVLPLLMLGGAYLCLEGVEKLAHRWLHPEAADQRDARLAALDDPQVDIVAFEREKIRGAIRTDFILSAEIIVIALGTVQAAPLSTRFMVLMTVAIAMTVGVYGAVAAIVKMDDLGLHLLRTAGDSWRAVLGRWCGARLLAAAPRMLSLLSVAGTVAMFLVGGSIIVHGWPTLGALLHAVEQQVPAAWGGAWLLGVLFEMVVGVLVGTLILGVVHCGIAIRDRMRAP